MPSVAQRIRPAMMESMTAKHAQDSEDSSSLDAETVAQVIRMQREWSFYRLYGLTLLIIVIALLVYVPFQRSYFEYEQLANESAARAALLADVPFDPGSLDVTLTPLTDDTDPLAGHQDAATRANQVVAYQTLASTYATKASDKQEWAIFALTAGVIGLVAVVVRSFRSYMGATYGNRWWERRRKLVVKGKQKVAERKERESWNKRAEATANWTYEKVAMP